MCFDQTLQNLFIYFNGVSSSKWLKNHIFFNQILKLPKSED